MKIINLNELKLIIHWYQISTVFSNISNTFTISEKRTRLQFDQRHKTDNQGWLEAFNKM